jgi:glycosyltransferase involved in cell wall biosynthesis
MNKPLNILYLVPDLFGPPSGIARYCRMVCHALVESNHQLTIIALHDKTDAQNEGKSTFPSVDYKACEGQRSLFVCRALQALRQKPDLIIVGHPHFAHLGWLLKRLSGARQSSFIYGIDAWEPLSFIRRRALNTSDHIISISRFTAKRAGEVNGVPPKKVRILYNCFDPGLYPKSTFNAANGNLSLLTVARISLSEQYKGHDVVIRTLPNLLEKFPHLVYDIVGDGDGRSVLETLAVELNVTHAVHFHGVVSEQQLIEYYQNASVFVMPSRFEGFGFVFLEAMAYGKAVVAGNEDASVEVVRNGKTGFTVAPQSTAEVANAIEALLGDNQLRQSMGENGREVVESEFGFDQFKQTLLGHIAELKIVAN